MNQPVRLVAALSFSVAMVLLTGVSSPAHAWPSRTYSAARLQGGGALGGLKAAVGGLRAKLGQKLQHAQRCVSNLLYGRTQCEATLVPPYIEDGIRKRAGKGSDGRKRPMPGEEGPASDPIGSDSQCQTGGSGLKRIIYDAAGYDMFPGKQVLAEGSSQTTDVASANSANQAIADFYGLNKALGFDAMKMACLGAIRATVRIGGMDNAAFVPLLRNPGAPQQILRNWVVFGTGSPQGPFKDFASSKDAIYHELGHGMSFNELVPPNLDGFIPPGGVSESKQRPAKQGVMGILAQLKQNLQTTIEVTVPDKLGRAYRAARNRVALPFQGQAGAVSESTSDIYAVMARQFGKKQRIKDLTEEDWCICRDVMKDDVENDSGHPTALRNMLFPGTAYNDPRLMGKDRQPDNIKDLYVGDNDNGGVHINAGIPNRAFALATIQYAKSDPNATMWESTGKAWLYGIKRAGTDATIEEAANAIYQTALTMFAKKPAMAEAIAEGWKQVGIDVNKTKGSQRAQRELRLLN